VVQEIGDLLFAVVNLARKAGVDPGTALDRANR
jgi:NTP pyrophosphatase (non-canonical NTP hydrolase)